MPDGTLPSIRVALEDEERIPTLDSTIDLWQRHLSSRGVAERLMNESDVVSLRLGQLLWCEVCLVECW